MQPVDCNVCVRAGPSENLSLNLQRSASFPGPVLLSPVMILDPLTFVLAELVP
jgi:hypothetical protein